MLVCRMHVVSQQFDIIDLVMITLIAIYFDIFEV